MLALGWQKGRLLGRGGKHPDAKDVQAHGKALWQGQTGMFEKWLFSPASPLRLLVLTAVLTCLLSGLPSKYNWKFSFPPCLVAAFDTFEYFLLLEMLSSFCPQDTASPYGSWTSSVGVPQSFKLLST